MVLGNVWHFPGNPEPPGNAGMRDPVFPTDCPYGIAACWGGASEALRSLEGVQYVDPIPDGDSSTATVYLEDDGLPALDLWDEQFQRMVRQAYQLRGVEVTLTGTIEERNDVLVLAGDGRRPPVELATVSRYA